MYTWGDVYSRLNHYDDRERELKQIHLAELAAEKKSRRSRRAPVNFAIAGLMFGGLIHLFAGMARLSTLRH